MNTEAIKKSDSNTIKNINLCIKLCFSHDHPSKLSCILEIYNIETPNIIFQDFKNDIISKRTNPEKIISKKQDAVINLIVLFVLDLEKDINI
jgi:hypothetical protein